MGSKVDPEIRDATIYDFELPVFKKYREFVRQCKRRIERMQQDAMPPTLIMFEESFWTYKIKPVMDATVYVDYPGTEEPGTIFGFPFIVADDRSMGDTNMRVISAYDQLKD